MTGSAKQIQNPSAKDFGLLANDGEKATARIYGSSFLAFATCAGVTIGPALPQELRM